MSLEAALWALAATLIGGFSTFIQRVIAKECRSSALSGVFMYAGAAIAALIALPFVDIPVSWQMVTFYAVLGGVIYAFGNYLRIESLKHIDSVIYFPLNKVLGPLVVIAGSIFFLGESLTWQQMTGVGLSVCVPLLLVSRNEKHRQNNLKMGLILLGASTAIIAVSTVLMKPGVTLDQSIFFFMAVSQVAGLIASVGIHARTHTDESHLASFSNRRDWELGLVMAVLSAAALYTLLKAMSLGQLSLVYTIHAHYILVPIILSVWWYGEHINARKLFAVLVSFVAIGLLI